MKHTLFILIITFFGQGLGAQTENDHRAIAQIVDDMAQSWTDGNGAGFAQHFADEHDYFVWNGLYIPDQSRARNAMAHQQLFDSHYRDTHHYAVLDKVRFVQDDVAVILVMSAVVPKNEPRPEHPQVLWQAVLTKSDDLWKIVSFHNADIELLDNAVSRANTPIPIEVMYKNWYSAKF